MAVNHRAHYKSCTHEQLGWKWCHMFEWLYFSFSFFISNEQNIEHEKVRQINIPRGIGLNWRETKIYYVQIQITDICILKSCKMLSLIFFHQHHLQHRRWCFCWHSFDWMMRFCRMCLLLRIFFFPWKGRASHECVNMCEARKNDINATYTYISISINQPIEHYIFNIMQSWIKNNLLYSQVKALLGALEVCFFTFLSL